MKKRITRCLSILMAVLMMVTAVDITAFAAGESGSSVSDAASADTEKRKTFTPAKNGSASAERAKNGFSFRQADYQLTGLLFRPEKSYKITVTGLNPNDPLPSIALSQNMQHFGEELVSTVKLNDGAETSEGGVRTVTKTISAPSDSYPGAIYIINPYTPEQQAGAVTVTVEASDGSALEWYPVYNNGGGTTGKTSFEEFQKQLTDYKALRESGKDFYPQYVDVCSDQVQITTSFDAAYDMYVGKKDDSGKGFNGTPDEILKSYKDALISMFQYAKIAEADYPKARQQIRAIGKNAPFFATNTYIGFDCGVPEHYSYEILKPGFVDGWAPLHELGHVLENYNISYPESTNNLYVLNRLVKDLGQGSRLKNEKRYDHLFSTFSSQKSNIYFYLPSYEVGNQNYNLEQLSIWDRLVMFDQLNQYFRQNDTEKREFWSEVTADARKFSLNGYQVNDHLSKIVLYAADVFGVDIRPMFHISSLDARFVLFTEEFREGLTGKTKELIESLDGLPKIPATVRYIDETYAANAANKLAEGTKAEIHEIKAKGSSNQLTIGLSDPTQASNLLGYEVYRVNIGTPLNEERDLIGYARAKAPVNGVTADEVTFSDTRNVAAYRFDYYAKPISKDLSEGSLSDKCSTTGEEPAAGALQVTEVVYNQLADELSVKGTGYQETNNGHDTYMQLKINEKTYDIIPEKKKNPEDTVDLKEYLHFIPGEGNTWEMRITEFGEKRDSGSELNITATYLEHTQIHEGDKDEPIDVYSPISYTGDLVYNLGDITADDTNSVLIKTLSVEQIRGHVVEKFDPMNFNYTGENQYVKTSLCEIDPEATIYTNDTVEMKLIPQLADIHAAYEIYITPYDDKNENLLKEKREKQTEGIISLSASRDSSKKWQAEILVTDSTGAAAAYVFDLYSPNENSYLYSFNVSNETKDVEGTVTKQTSIKALNKDYMEASLLIDQLAGADTDAKVPVTIKAEAQREGAAIAYYHKANGGERDADIEPNGGLETYQLTNGDVKVGVTAQDGITFKEYSIVAQLSEEAKAVADLRGVEFLSKLQQTGFVKEHHENQNTETKSKFDEIYYISPIISDADTDGMYINPSIKYYFSEDGTKEKSAAFKWEAFDKDWKSIGLDTIGIELVEGEKTVHMPIGDFKKLVADENGDYNHNGNNLLLTITSPDGKQTKKILFCCSLSDRAPLKPHQNYFSNFALFDAETYTPENAGNATMDGTIDPDKSNYIYVPNSEEAVYFNPDTYVGLADSGEVEEYVNGALQKVERDDNSRFTMSPDATGFIYRVNSPDKTKIFTYYFTKYRPTDSSLQNLTINGYLVHQDQNGNLVEGFDPSVTEYYMLTNNLDNIEVKPVANDQKAASLITLDGKAKPDEVKITNRARFRTYQEVQENNEKTGEVKELEVNVTAQSQSTTTYTIIVSDTFDFMELPELMNENEKADLEAKIAEAQETAAKGNFDDTFYSGLTKAIANAQASVGSAYTSKSEYESVKTILENKTNHYNNFLKEIESFIDLYNEMMPEIIKPAEELRTPTELREKIKKDVIDKGIGGGNLIGRNKKYTIRYSGVDDRWHVSEPGSLGNFKKFVFFVKGKLEPTKIHEYATEIGAFAFKDSGNIEVSWDPKKVTSIGYGAFENCTDLTKISSLDGISVGNRAFWNTKIGVSQDGAANTVPKDKAWIYDENHVLTGSSALGSASEITTLEIPGEAAEIAPYAFYGMKGITTVKVPFMTAKIGQGAFLNAEGLEKAIIIGNKLTLNNVFDSTVKIEKTDKLPTYEVTLKKVMDGQEASQGQGLELKLKGAGTYNAGDKATIAASSNSQYQFAGWKYSEADEKYFSTSATIEIPVTKDLELTAVYTAALTYDLTVNQTGSGTVQADGKEISAGSTVTGILYEQKVALSAAPADGWKFKGWYTNGRCVSEGAAYTITVLGNQTVEAKFVENSKYTVTFKDFDGKVLKVQTLAKGESAAAPENISRPGYDFAGWDKDFKQVTENMVITSVWTKQEISYQITAENGIILDYLGAEKTKFGFSERVTVIADPAPRGTVFSHWEDGEGRLISYSSTYIFSAVQNMKLKAVYEKEVKEQPIALLSNIIVKEDIKKMSFMCQVTLPEGYEKVECGLVLYKGNLTEELTLHTAGAIKGKSALQNSRGQYSMTTKVSSGISAYGRAYLTYRDSDGGLFTVYSDMMQGTMK